MITFRSREESEDSGRFGDSIVIRFGVGSRSCGDTGYGDCRDVWNGLRDGGWTSLGRSYEGDGRIDRR